MKNTNTQYREEMQEPFRNRWELGLYVGYINQEFQDGCYTTGFSPVSPLSHTPDDENNLLKNRELGISPATFEKDMWKADGKTDMSNGNEVEGIQYIGVFSDELSDSNGVIDFSMGFNGGGNVVKQGLTLRFVDNYPTQINVVNRTTRGVVVFSKTYTNDSLEFSTSDNFYGTYTDDYGITWEGMILQIRYTMMNKPFVRARTSQILFGVGQNYTNEDILSQGGGYKYFSHPCSVELPSIDMDIALDNYDGRFDFDRPNSLANMVNVGQQVRLQYVYTNFNGSKTIIPMEYLKIKDFDVNNNQMKIKAVDFLTNEDVVVNTGDLREALGSNIPTVYNICEILERYFSDSTFSIDVDASAGTEIVDIPPYNDDIMVKEVIQYLAGCARCQIYFTERGVSLKREIMTQDVQYSIESTNKTVYSDLDILTNTDTKDMATFELNDATGDGTFVIPGDGLDEMYKTGYISESMSDGGGYFTTLPKITFTLSESVQPKTLIFKTKHCEVRQYKVTTYYLGDDKQWKFISTIVATNYSGDTVVLNTDFKAFQKLELEIVNIDKPYKRLEIPYFSLSSEVYDLNKDVVKFNGLKQAMNDTIRNIIVYFRPTTIYESDNEVIPCNLHGTDVEYSNPFINGWEQAIKVGEWLREYYTSKIDYDVDFIGDPSIEVGDVIRLPNQYNDNLLTQVETCETTFTNGGIGGKLKVRRLENV